MVWNRSLSVMFVWQLHVALRHHCLHCANWFPHGADMSLCYFSRQQHPFPGSVSYAFHMSTDGGKQYYLEDKKSTNIYFKWNIFKWQQEPMVPESWQWRFPCEFGNINAFAKCTNDLWFCKKKPVHFTWMFAWSPYLDNRRDNMHIKDIYQYIPIELLPI